MNSTTTLDAALDYAIRGWAVVAIHSVLPSGRCGCGKLDCPSPGKHPRYHADDLSSGVHSATIDPTLIKQWWSRWPDSNVAIAMEPSDLVALDEDPRNGGSLDDLPLADDERQTLTSQSGGGGRHLVYSRPPDIQLHSSNLPGGIDLIDRGKMLMAAPSRHQSGEFYRWADGLGPDDDVLRTLPDSLLDLLTATPKAASNPASIGEIQQGGRNQALTSLAGTMRRRGMSVKSIEVALLAENQSRCVPPLPDGEVRQIAQGMGRYAPGAQDSSHPLTQFGNAQRLVERHGHSLRYCHPWQKWLVWDGKRWLPDATDAAVRLAKETVRHIQMEAIDETDEERSKQITKWALNSQTHSQVSAMLSLATSEPNIAILPDRLDKDLWLLNCENGTLDLRTGTLRPHQPADFITKLAPVAYDAAASAPVWQAFLRQITQRDQPLADYLQRLAGYSLTGDTSERIMIILWGNGRNGKTTFVETLAMLLGDYSKRTPTDTLMARRRSAIPNDVARLRGARCVIATESEVDQRLAEAMVKELTGGDTLVARFMRAEWFEFRAEFTLWLATNHRPIIDGSDPAIWDRLRLVPFSLRIPEGQIDYQLRQKLAQEQSGILAWAVEGCLAWQKHGLQTPPVVLDATASYQAEMDDVGEFLSDVCQLSGHGQISKRLLYEAYQSWCKENGDLPMSKRALGSRLRTMGFDDGKNDGVRFWRGIDVASSSTSQVSAPQLGSGTQRDTNSQTDHLAPRPPSNSISMSRSVPSSSGMESNTTVQDRMNGKEPPPHA